MTTDEATQLGHAWAAYAIQQVSTYDDTFPGTAQEARERIVDEVDGLSAADVERLAVMLLEAAQGRWTTLLEDLRYHEDYARDRSQHSRWVTARA